MLNVLLSHQRADQLAPLLRIWRRVAQESTLLLAYGGARSDFDHLTHEPRIFIDDTRLRTRDHQREYQSYTGLLKAVQGWIEAAACAADYIYLAEYDHIPLVADLNARQTARMQSEDADLLGFHLQRIDGTNHPHYLYHVANPRFEAWLQPITARRDAGVTLSMLGTGSVWTREAFASVAAMDEPFPMYFELYLPTLAHHLGFRVRDWADQNPFVVNKGDRGAEIGAAQQAGAWTLHPVKNLPPAFAID